MASWIEVDKTLTDVAWNSLSKALSSIAQQIVEEAEDESITFCLCDNCERCIERGGHANCRGYLYCTLHKTQVTESDGCTWGRER